MPMWPHWAVHFRPLSPSRKYHLAAIQHQTTVPSQIRSKLNLKLVKKKIRIVSIAKLNFYFWSAWNIQRKKIHSFVNYKFKNILKNIKIKFESNLKNQINAMKIHDSVRFNVYTIFSWSKKQICQFHMFHLLFSSHKRNTHLNS